MKSASTPRLLALALAAGAASLAHAQSAPSVTLYGLLDAYVEYRTHNNAAGDSRTALNSGGMNTSRWGMRGSEDLGGGLKAIFQLEGELSLDTGAGGSSLFGRQANVGLEGGFGRVIAGRSYSTSYDFILPFDPMGYAPVYSWATSAGATGARKDGMVTGVSNLVKYRGKVGGFSFGASYGFGEQAGSFSDGHTVNLGASYAAGPLAVVATVEQINGVSDATTGARDKTRTAHIGASYAFGDTVKLFGVLRDYSKEFGAGGDDNDSRTWWIGANWLPMPGLTLTAAYYAQDIRSSNVAPTVDDPSLIVLRARYALSKRTDVYATLGYADGKDGVVGLSRDDVTFGSDQTGVAVGIQHRF
ncbi:porin [Caldimonas sp. KR1-144]|uniref:porin n=1 Tax=Caldimonas sp. KR1-144 TaxID=3400911 RepID=UPI003BFD8F6B